MTAAASPSTGPRCWCGRDGCLEIGAFIRGKDVFVLQSTCQPTNDTLMEVMVMVDALKRASAGRITAAWRATMISSSISTVSGAVSRRKRRPEASVVPRRSPVLHHCPAVTAQVSDEVVELGDQSVRHRGVHEQQCFAAMMNREAERLGRGQVIELD